MKYVIIGAGGTGGIVGAYMSKAGRDVTLIARSEHLERMKKDGLRLTRIWEEADEIVKVKACSMEEYEGTADVVIVCVKGYSLESTIPFIKRISNENTVVIPILNIYGTGGRMQEKLPGILVTDGCIYVSANIQEPGTILQHGKICRIIFGVRDDKDYRPVLREIAKDFEASGIRGILSNNIKRDALQKFSYVSPIGAAGLYFDAAAGDFQKEGEPREMFKAMTREIITLAEAMGICFGNDLVEVNLRILEALAPEATTSMQRDVMAGRQSEMDGLIFEVVRMAKQYGVPVPEYEKVAAKFGFTV